MNSKARNAYVIGVDYGTDSVRSVVADAENGKEIASSVFYYPRWKDGLYCDAGANRFRQHPLDHIEGLETSILQCLQKAGKEAAQHIKGISIDTTGSTPVAVDAKGTPLALLPGFEHNPNAMFVLWKDHTAIEEAAAINAHAQKFSTDYLQFVGGIYSSEWFWAKLLHVLKEDEAVRMHIASWAEHCDWIPFLLTGGQDVRQMKRSICAAGHKALWSEAFDGYPPESFFSSLDPLLKGFRDTLPAATYSADKPAGKISREWADRLGLPEDVVIGVGAFDAHMGAVGGQIEPYHLTKVMGTSTCDMLVAPAADVKNTLVKGICGQVNGSIIPGMMGMEAGQSAFGDVYAWCRDRFKEPIEELSAAASALPLHESDELAVDWLNGRRTPDANQSLKAAIINLDLASDAPGIFKAMVEATCFGARAIIDRFSAQGIPVKGLTGVGSVAKKSPYIMQVMANVTNMPLRVHRSEQTCANGAAMFAATAAGLYEKVEDAMQAMGQGFEVTYLPDESQRAHYDRRYETYQLLGGFLEQETNKKKNATKKNKYARIREEACEANIKLPKLGLVLFTFGNVSAADRELEVFAIKPSGLPYDALSPEKMVIVDFDGKVIEGKLRPSSDTKTHAVLYKHWPIGGICHTHSLYATAWAQSGRDIPIFGTTHADHNTCNVPCAPPMDDARIQGDYELETGYQILDCFREKNIDPRMVEMILVGNHAPFTWGKDADKAVYNSAVLENIAQLALLTEQIRADAPVLKDALIQKHFERKHGPSSYYGQP